jgi:hypothetical protein
VSNSWAYSLPPCIDHVLDTIEVDVFAKPFPRIGARFKGNAVRSNTRCGKNNVRANIGAHINEKIIRTQEMKHECHFFKFVTADGPIACSAR